MGEKTYKIPSSAKKIVLLVPGFPKDEKDSACIPPLQQFVFYLAKTSPNIEITVITFQYPFNKGKYRWHNVEVYACGGRNGRRLARVYTWLKAANYFFKIHRKKNITTIHSFWLDECTLLGQYLSKLFNIHQISTVMGQDVRSSNKYLKWLNFTGKTVIAPSHTTKELLHQNAGYWVDKIIPIGLDVENFSKKARGVPKRHIDIIGVGALTSLKNYRLFVQLAGEVKLNFPDLKCMIIGVGPELTLLQNLIKEKGMQDTIQLTGRLPRKQVLSYMYQSRILLHTSTYESQGYVLMEALYCGLTVISFDVGYNKPSDRMIVCHDENEMGDKLKSIFGERLDDKPLLLKPIEETIKEYAELYV